MTLRADRDSVWITRSGRELARYVRSYEPGTWSPPPRPRAAPAPAPAHIPMPAIAPPELSDYAEICA